MNEPCMDMNVDRQNVTTYSAVCELRQPLTTVLGRCQLARLRLGRGDTEAALAELDEAIEQGWRLAAMLKELAR